MQTETDALLPKQEVPKKESTSEESQKMLVKFSILTVVSVSTTLGLTYYLMEMAPAELSTPIIVAVAVSGLVLICFVIAGTMVLYGPPNAQVAPMPVADVDSKTKALLRTFLDEPSLERALKEAKALNEEEILARNWAAADDDNIPTGLRKITSSGNLSMSSGILSIDTLGMSEGTASGSRSMAYLFPDTTVLFAKIGGFYAWSSERTPEQSFSFLETLDIAFGNIAKQLDVFQVDSIGCHFSAITGVHSPQKDHAKVMAKFAQACMIEFKAVIHSLGVSLGPGTADLSLQIGMHSGPVTAGVKRGGQADRSPRFQLLGDTVRIAALMNETATEGENSIQMSSVTGELVRKAGMKEYVKARETNVVDEMPSFWLLPIEEKILGDSMRKANLDMDAVSEKAGITIPILEEEQKLIDWVVDEFAWLLQKIVARERLVSTEAGDPGDLRYVPEGSILAEIKDFLPFPNPPSDEVLIDEDPQKVDLPEMVLVELLNYVTTLTTMYNHVAFHNFERSCHVAMLVVKFLEQISSYTAPSPVPGRQSMKQLPYMEQLICDPLAQFAVVFAALIQDLDHQGVSAEQLAKKNKRLAEKYNMKCIAKQNAIDLAWELLMDPSYIHLRKAISSNSLSELERFRHVVVQLVLATDSSDSEIVKAREQRLDDAFLKRKKNPNALDTNRMATVVLEQLMQAANVFHGLEHWEIYLKWSEKLFIEEYQAFKAGYSESEPSNDWKARQGEFLSKTIVPMATRLKSGCGRHTFGTASHECVYFAEGNVTHWESMGTKITTELIEKTKSLKAKNGDV